MGFARKSYAITQGLEVMRQGLYARLDTAMVRMTAVSMRIQAGIQRRAAWRTHSRGGKGQIEPQTFFGELVNVRGADYIIAIAAYVVNALVVSKKQDDVGFGFTYVSRGLLCSTCTSLNSDRGRGQTHSVQKITPI